MKSEGWKKEKTLSRKLSSAIFELRALLRRTKNEYGKAELSSLLFFVDCFGEVGNQGGAAEVKRLIASQQSRFCRAIKKLGNSGKKRCITGRLESARK